MLMKCIYFTTCQLKSFIESQVNFKTIQNFQLNYVYGKQNSMLHALVIWICNQIPILNNSQKSVRRVIHGFSKYLKVSFKLHSTIAMRKPM